MATRLVKLSGILAAAVVFLSAGMFLVFYPDKEEETEMIDCRSVFDESQGKYKNLARVDADGYVYPFARITLDTKSYGEFVFGSERAGGIKIRTINYATLESLQQMKFRCTNRDIATADAGVRIYKEGILVYETDIVLGQGLQNEAFGFVEVDNKLNFWMFFLF